jgi:S1-C subfamily serine protease
MSIAPAVPRRIVLLLVVGLLVVASAAAAAAVIALARGTTTTSVGDGVVVINTNLAYQGNAAAGTGMVLTSSGEVLTNNHVISGATTIDVLVPTTGQSYKADVLGYDRTADVALLQLEGASRLKTVSISSGTLSAGAAVTALGNANGDGEVAPAAGTVTGLGQSITASDETGGPEQLTGLIRTNAGLQPGDSGGPLVDSKGQVVGMDTAASTRSGFQGDAATEAYAIPIANALTVAHAVSSGAASATVHVGATAFLGVQVEAADTGASSAGAVISGVVPGGPAVSAGLSAADVITALNGHTVSSPTDVSALVLTEKPGSQTTVSYLDQSGTSRSATVTLGSGPPQ